MNFFIRRTLMVLIGSVFIAYTSNGQANQIIRFAQAGIADANKLTNAYFNPLIEGLSYGVNAGWYHTARPHKQLGFDISFSVSGVFLPGSQRTFRPADLGLENTVLINNASGEVPTLIGPDVVTNYQTTVETPGGPEVIDFEGAEGLDFKDRWGIAGVAVPMVQAGVGIGMGTDLKVRFMPTVDLGSFSHARMIGAGLLHDIKQHIPGLRIKAFDLSVLVGFTRVSGAVSTATSAIPRPENDPRPQEMPFDVNAWLIQALISKKLTTVTFYGGIGYNAVKSSANVRGSYVIFDDGNGNQAILTDPVNLSFRNNSMRMTAGMRLNFGVFYLNGDYTWQEYSTISLGLGFTNR